MISERHFSIALVAGASALFCAFEVFAQEPAHAPESAQCVGVTVLAGTSVLSLFSGETLGQLTSDVSVIDCDDSFYLVPWEGGAGVVSRPDAAFDQPGGATRSLNHKATPGCNENSTSVGCVARRQLISKVRDWRLRFGEHRKS